MDNNPRLNTALGIFYGWTIINVTASFITILLMAFMYRNGTLKINLYIKCVALLTVYQMMYDTAIIPFAHICTPSHGNSLCTANSVAGFVIGGCGAAGFSLLIVLGACFTVEFNRKLTNFEEMTTMIFMHVLMVAYAIPNYIVAINSYENPNDFSAVLGLYQYVRFGLIGLSFLAVTRMYILLIKISVKYERKKSPLYHLLNKIVFYPIVQSITRLGTTPYILMYHDFMAKYPMDAPPLQTVLLYFEVALTPAAGILTFFVFLSVQRSAKEELKRMICLDFEIRPNETFKKRTERRSSTSSVGVRRSSNGHAQFEKPAIKGILSTMQEEEYDTCEGNKVDPSFTYRSSLDAVNPISRHTVHDLRDEAEEDMDGHEWLDMDEDDLLVELLISQQPTEMTATQLQSPLHKPGAYPEADIEMRDSIPQATSDASAAPAAITGPYIN